jgi:hypothetical protein
MFTEFETVPTSYFHRVLGYQTGKDVISELNIYGYIRIARGFGKQLDARNREALWEGTKKGERLLGYPFKRAGDPFGHKAHRDVIWFSFWIAPYEVPGLSLRTAGDILAHDNCPPETRLESTPSHFTVGDRTVRPDHDIFGYALTRSGRTRYMYFQGFEADGGTETRTPDPENFNASKKKNITKMVRDYRDYLSARGYEDRYGISNISVPIIAKSGTDMRSIMEVVERECDPDTYGSVRDQFIFKHAPGFTEGYPPASGHMVTEDWHQVGEACSTSWTSWKETPMDDHERAARAMQLSREIREKEAELTRLFGGEAQRQRAPQRCGHCNQLGHTKANCPSSETRPA